MIKFVVSLIAILNLIVGLAAASEMRLAVTTSFHNSGLSGVLLPQIKNDLGIDVQLLVVGTGQALKLGRSGDVDAILVHSKGAELEFINAGFATHRREIMFNDFVFVGPRNDPASVAKATSAAQVLSNITNTQSVFVSRGDDSGTHRKELALWEKADLDHQAQSPDWYRQIGAGMGATLNAASAMNAYALTDRASWLNFGNKGELDLLFSGDPILNNQYAYLPINHIKHDHINRDAVDTLEKWLVGKKAQALIRSYKIKGQTLFTPNAKP